MSEQQKQYFGGGFKVSEIDSEERTVTAIITSDAIDRDDEVLLPKGANIEQFEKNPVVLWSHNSSLPPIGKVEWIKRGTGKITAKVKFAATDLAEEVWQLFKGGFLKAFSIGFMPIESRVPTPDDIRKRPEWAVVRRIFSAYELLELSAVAVPSNPQALATAIKSGKFEVIAKDFNLPEVEDEPEEEDIKEPEPIEVKATSFIAKPHVKMKRHIEMSLSGTMEKGVSEAIKIKRGIVY